MTFHNYWYCNICGEFGWRDVDDIAGDLLPCGHKDSLTHTMTGWICPKCKIGLAPWLAVCPNCRTPVTFTNQTGPTEFKDG